MSQNDFVEIDISKIDVNETNKYHFRKLIKQDAVDAIVRTLEHGPLYQPIIVTKSEDGRYQVVDGEHRLLAHRKLDKEQIMALIIPERDAVIWGIKANILRSDYNSMEKSNALQKLFDIKKEELGESGKYGQNALFPVYLADDVIKRSRGQGFSSCLPSDKGHFKGEIFQLIITSSLEPVKAYQLPINS